MEKVNVYHLSTAYEGPFWWIAVGPMHVLVSQYPLDGANHQEYVQQATHFVERLVRIYKG